MASKPLRPCRAPGCANLTREGYCDRHRGLAKTRRTSAAWHDWYKLPVWKRQLRPQQLLRKPFCRVCAAQGKRKRATEVDHITPHRGRWSLFVDPSNLQSLCHTCHSAKTMRELNASMQESG